MTNTTATPPAFPTGPTPGDWRYYRVKDSDLPTGYCHLIGAFTGDGDRTPSGMICELEPLPGVEANGNLLGAAPRLLRVARLAANAFEERLSVLHDERQELVDAGVEGEDLSGIDDRIGNYQFLLDRHAAVIAEAEGRAARAL